MNVMKENTLYIIIIKKPLNVNNVLLVVIIVDYPKYLIDLHFIVKNVHQGMKPILQMIKHVPRLPLPVNLMNMLLN